MVADCVKAIIGWEPTSRGNTYIGIGIAYLTSLGKQVCIGLCGVDELTQQANNKVLSGMVAIQCGGGSWMRTVRLPDNVPMQDLSKFSNFQGNYDGVLPKLSQCYDMTFDSLIGEFEKLWSNLNLLERAIDRKIVFLCARLGSTGRMHA